ncbi:MAG: N-acetylmuramoyl-L-alanine amidase [Candidatus Omnitrophota bacterium]
MSKKFFSFAWIALFLCAGCATTSKFSYPTTTINNAPYFAVIQMCEREGFKWDYDPLSQVLVLKADDREIKLLVNSTTLVVDRQLKDLSAPPVIRDSVVYAPLDLQDFLRKSVCKVPLAVSATGAVYLKNVQTIVLDAGHGGKDPGAIGKNGTREKNVVLDVTQKVKEELERCGFKVILTREGDQFIALQQRAQIANVQKADLFISIHANANRSRWIEGFEVYYLTETIDDNARALAASENFPHSLPNQGYLYPSSPLKAILWDMVFTEDRKESIELAQSICSAVAQTMDLKMLGVKGAPFLVLKGARMPAVLVEIGYLSNGDGEKKLRGASYRRKMAQAIAQGIVNFKYYCEGTWTNR